MFKESNHGSFKFTHNLDGDALGKLVTATFSSQEDHSHYFKEALSMNEIIMPKNESPISDRRLDAYHFYYSSKL